MARDRGGVTVNHAKVGKSAFVPLSADFLRELAARERAHASGHLIEWRGRPVKNFGKSLLSAAARAGVEIRCPYCIRHLWITTMIDQGVEMSTIAHLAGTSVRMITQNYYEPRGALQRAVSSLPLPTRPKRSAPRSAPKKRAWTLTSRPF